MPPSIGNTATEIFQRWRELCRTENYPGYKLVGRIPAEGEYSWRDGVIVRLFINSDKRGSAESYRPATEAEIARIHDAIEKGWFEVDRRQTEGCLGYGFTGVRRHQDPIYVYHQATGRPPGSLPIQPTEQPKKKRKQKAKPEKIFTGDKVLLTDPTTGKPIGA